MKTVLCLNQIAYSIL